MATNDNGSAPAYPRAVPEYNERGYIVQTIYDDGFTKRERAAIDLRVADSGSEWLDRMIEEANRRDMATAICAGMCSLRYEDVVPHGNLDPYSYIANDAAKQAAALLAALAKEKNDV